MAFCTKCGTENSADAAFCSGCGTPLKEQTMNQQGTNFTEDFKKFTTTSDLTGEYTAEDISRNRVMAIFAYILFLIPLFAAKNSKYARFHTNQGMVIALSSIAVSITVRITCTILNAIRLYPLSTLFGALGTLISIGFIPLTVFGIIYASKGQAKELPLVNKIKILK